MKKDYFLVFVLLGLLATLFLFFCGSGLAYGNETITGVSVADVSNTRTTPSVEKVNYPVRYAYHIGEHERRDHHHRRHRRRHRHHGHHRRGCDCCVHGRYYRLLPSKCIKRGGHCYETQEEAEEACHELLLQYCGKKMPNPRIKYERTTPEGVIYISVVNWSDYNDEMFRKARELPACGRNRYASRTWIDVYDADTNQKIKGFCALTSARDLSHIWFKPVGITVRHVYLVMKDRTCEREYRSNVLFCLPAGNRRPTGRRKVEMPAKKVNDNTKLGPKPGFAH